MSVRENAPLIATSGNSRLVFKRRALIAALLASTAYAGLSTSPASATIYTPPDDTTYDSNVGTFANGDTINVTVPVTHNGNLSLITNGILNINAGGSITNDTGGLWGTGIALTISGGTSVTIDGFDASGTVIPLLGIVDTFGSLAGAGTLNVTGGGVVFGGNNASTAFSGTVVMPTLNNFLGKTGTGRFTINNMTMAQGELLDGSTGGGGLTLTSGTANIKSIAVGTGVGNNTMLMSGGILNITGTISGPPCGSDCPALRIGDFFGTGVLNQTAGTINVGAAGVAASMNIGNQSGNGTYTISAGATLNLGVLGDATSAGLYGIARQASGSAAHIGQTTTGVFNISGGTVNVNAGELINGDRDAGGAAGVITSSTINLSGGTLSIKNGANLWLSAANNAAATDSIFNLTGGTLEVGDGRLKDNYLAGATYEFNLGNGTIKVIDSDLTTTVHGTLTGLTAGTGVKIDTNGLIANWNGLLDGAGWLVKTGAGTLNLGGLGNTYTGGTAFNGGVVVVDATADLGAVGSAMSFNGGTLRLDAGGVLSPKSGGVTMAGAGTIDTNGFNDALTTTITGSGALTKVGAGALTLSANNNAHTGALNINAGSVNAHNGNGIGDTSALTVAGGATLNVEFGVTETIGSLAGAGNVQIRDSMTLVTGGNGASTTYSGVLSEGFGVGKLTKTGTGVFTVNANTTYTGLTTVNQGTMLLNGTMADGLLVAAGATFGGNATVTGNVANNGHIAPGNSPGTQVYLGNYTAGVGAIFDMEVVFNSANAPVNGTTHDFVNMTNAGATITGTTLLNIIPFAPSGAPQPTTGNGIELVRVAAPVAGNQFALAAPVFVGGYQYVLTYVPSAGPDSWYLRSQVGEGVFGAAAMFSAGQAMTGSCFGAGEELAFSDNSQSKRVWAKGTMGSRETGADTGLTSEQDYTCGSGGADLRAGDGDVRVGIMGGFGNTDVDVTTLAGIGTLEGDGTAVQLYAVYLHDHVYATMQLGYGSYDWTFDGPLTAPTAAETSGILGAFETGMRWPLSEAWRIGLSGGIAYDGMSCDSSCLLTGLTDDPAEWSAKGALRLDGNMGSWRTFAALGLSDRFGENNVTVGTATTTTDTDSSMLDLSAGLGVRLASNVEFFVGGHYGESLDKDVDQFDGNGGIKIAW
ncbi:MAG: autotransporter-associated beta strand repeat-containing protein [Alphaproteobacteria bacterium]|nr:autotransporter-associated beta strand repeat-containing protein [Alphaproteobacteria bacterium]